MAVSGVALPGGTLEYVVTIRNSGPVAQSSVIVSDLMPSTTRLLQATSTSGTVTVDAQDGLVTWTGPLAADEDVTLTVTARILQSTGPGTVLENQATVAFDSSGDTVRDALAVSSDVNGPPGSPTRVVVRFFDEIFADRFETGDVSCWNVPQAGACPSLPPGIDP